METYTILATGCVVGIGLSYLFNRIFSTQPKIDTDTCTRFLSEQGYSVHLRRLNKNE